MEKRDVTPSAAKLRTLLAILLLQRGSTVTSEELIDDLWGNGPPRTAAATLQSYIYKLRKFLTEEWTGDGPQLTTMPDGYRLDADGDAVDVWWFADLSRRAVLALDADDATTALELTGSAMTLWRGAPFGGLHRGERLSAVAVGLDQTRIRVAEVAARASLRLGRHRELVGELRQLTLELPLHEELHSLLIEALRRSGLRAEALQVYQQLRRSLVAELGIDPSPAVQHLQSLLLADGDTGSAAAVSGWTDQAAAPGSHSAALPVPAQLPADISDFVGREREFAELSTLLLEPRGTALRIVSITGMPGIGKTAFAVRLAHQLRRHFDGGQLVARLRGSASDAGGAADPEIVLARFLRAAGFDDRMLPRDGEERADLFRTWSSSRRLLVLLDDAASLDQVRSLLPGGPDCAVVLTGRGRMHGPPGADDIRLAPLTDEDSVRLLSAELGRWVDPTTGRGIARRCGGLPLALRCVAFRARSGRMSPAALLQQMCRDLPALLTSGELDVLGHLAASWQRLDGAEKDVLAVIASRMAAPFSATDLAYLLPVGHDTAASLMFRLTELDLVEVEVDDDRRPTQYSVHPLVRLAVVRADDRSGGRHLAVGQ